MIEKIIGDGNYGITLELKGSILMIWELGDAKGFPKEVVLFGVEVGILKDFLIENEENFFPYKVIEKKIEGKPWDIMNACRNYIAESMGIEKEYKVIIRIEEL